MVNVNFKRVAVASLTAVADAIRDKARISGSLVFPNGFIQAIEEMDAGGDTYGATMITGTQTVYKSNFAGEVPRYAFYRNPIIKLELPNATSLGNYSCGRMTLTEISIPNVDAFGEYAFYLSHVDDYGDLSKVETVGQYCFSGASASDMSGSSNCDLVLENATSIGSYACQYSVHRAIAFLSAENIRNYMFRGAQATGVLIPAAVTIGQYAFQLANLGSSILTIPRTVTTLNQYSFAQIKCGKIVFEGQVPTIPAYCFYQIGYTTGVPRYYDFSNCTTIPTLSNVNAFNGINNNTSNIVVPDELYDQWITTTNWSNSNIKSKIVKKSDYSG